MVTTGKHSGVCLTSGISKRLTVCSRATVITRTLRGRGSRGRTSTAASKALQQSMSLIISSKGALPPLPVPCSRYNHRESSILQPRMALYLSIVVSLEVESQQTKMLSCQTPSSPSILGLLQVVMPSVPRHHPSPATRLPCGLATSLRSRSICGANRPLL